MTTDDIPAQVRWARSQPGVHAVSVDWLASCGFLWRAADEHEWPVEGVAPGAAGSSTLCLGPGGSTLPPPQMQ